METTIKKEKELKICDLSTNDVSAGTNAESSINKVKNPNSTKEIITQGSINNVKNPNSTKETVAQDSIKNVENPNNTKETGAQDNIDNVNSKSTIEKIIKCDECGMQQDSSLNQNVEHDRFNRACIRKV
ncbi:hypothetical protein HNY73_018822 [Argiope bruennichi]|nr:hypothetical protein HNY73_018822 [Argiope bruennichi]